MEEWEQWEFARTSSDEEDRRTRRAFTLAAIDRFLGRKPVAVAAPVSAEKPIPPSPLAVQRPLAACPTAVIAMNTNNEKRRLGVPVKGDPKVSAAAFEKRAYTPADARADRDRWLANAKRISGR